MAELDVHEYIWPFIYIKLIRSSIRNKIRVPGYNESLLAGGGVAVALIAGRWESTGRYGGEGVKSSCHCIVCTHHLVWLGFNINSLECFVLVSSKQGGGFQVKDRRKKPQS